MSILSLNPDMKIVVTARFIGKGKDLPLTGYGYELRLFDKDLMEDDYLGKSALDENGTATISFTHHSFGDNFNIEQMPDFYFALYKEDELIFQSKVMEDMDIKSLQQFAMGKGNVIDLGTFLVDK